MDQTNKEESDEGIENTLLASIAKITKRRVLIQKDGEAVILLREFICIDDIRMNALIARNRTRKDKIRKILTIDNAYINDGEDSYEDISGYSDIFFEENAEDEDKTKKRKYTYRSLKALSLLYETEDYNVTREDVIETIDYNLYVEDKRQVVKDVKIENTDIQFNKQFELVNFKNRLIYEENGFKIPEKQKNRLDLSNVFGIQAVPRYFKNWIRLYIAQLLLKNNNELTWSDGKNIVNSMYPLFVCRDFIFYYNNFYSTDQYCKEVVEIKEETNNFKSD